MSYLGVLIQSMDNLSFSGQCQNILISLLLICTLFQYGLNFQTSHSSADLLNVCLRSLASLVNMFKVTCLPLLCQDSHMPGCWWKSTCYLICLTPLKLLYQMTAYSINKLFMKLYRIFASTAEPLATLLQLAPNPRLLMFQANSQLMTLPLFLKASEAKTLFSII